MLDGLTAEGLLVEPVSGTRPASLVAVPDAGQTPEQILGLAPGLPPERQFARTLAESGCELVIPTLIRRELIQTDDPQLREQAVRASSYKPADHYILFLFTVEYAFMNQYVDGNATPRRWQSPS